MKIDIEMYYYVEPVASFEAGVLFHDGIDFRQFSLLYFKPEDESELEKWTIIEKMKYYDIDCVLHEIPEEEYFQLSTVWSCPIRMEFIRDIQRYVIQDKPNWEKNSALENPIELTLEY